MKFDTHIAGVWFTYQIAIFGGTWNLSGSGKVHRIHLARISTYCFWKMMKFDTHIVGGLCKQKCWQNLKSPLPEYPFNADLPDTRISGKYYVTGKFVLESLTTVRHLYSENLLRDLKLSSFKAIKFKIIEFHKLYSVGIDSRGPEWPNRKFLSKV